jgi:hypothetical protein
VRLYELSSLQKELPVKLMNGARARAAVNNKAFALPLFLLFSWLGTNVAEAARMGKPVMWSFMVRADRLFPGKQATLFTSGDSDCQQGRSLQPPGLAPHGIMPRPCLLPVRRTQGGRRFFAPGAVNQLEKEIIPSGFADIGRSYSLITAPKEDTVGKVFKCGSAVCIACNLG